MNIGFLLLSKPVCMFQVNLILIFQYLRLAATLKYYGFVQFRPCISDYPQPGCRAIIAAGNRELNFRVQVSSVSQLDPLLNIQPHYGMLHQILAWVFLAHLSSFRPYIWELQHKQRQVCTIFLISSCIFSPSFSQ